jgi:hypothetical protein
VKSSTLPEAKLHKRHTLLSFHRVREAIAARFIYFIHIDGRINPADILSKHWGHSQVWENLKPLLFWMGDTIQSLTGRSKEDIMDPVEVAKKDKIGEMAVHTTGQTEKKVGIDRSSVEKVKSEDGATMEEEEVKLGHKVVEGKGLKYAKKASVHSFRKGGECQKVKRTELESRVIVTRRTWIPFSWYVRPASAQRRRMSAAGKVPNAMPMRMVGE